MKRKTMMLLGVLVVVVLIGGGLALKSYLDLQTYRQQVAAIQVADVDLQGINDGIYTGNCETLWVAAEVKVWVKDHKITAIKLVKHVNGRGAPAEVIPDRVVAAQSLKVDVVSGCTSSSKVILKAIERALQ